MSNINIFLLAVWYYNYTIGLDLGDKGHEICVIGNEGIIIRQDKIPNSKMSLSKLCQEYPQSKCVIEAGLHSPWISRLLKSKGMSVLVANARKLRMIYQNERKSDSRDAEMLARVGRFDPQLLSPIAHKSLKAHKDLQKIKSRDALVRARTSMINHLRGSLKSMGSPLPACATSSFAKKVRENLENTIYFEIHEKMIEIIESLTQKINLAQKELKNLIETTYPEAIILQNIQGVGPITALSFILCIENPHRFAKNRQIGAYLGLVPRRDQSGATDKQLRISKCGNPYLRCLLVQCAQYIMGHFAKPCDLREFGLKIAEKKGKKKAAIAVARKLSVMLLSIWKSGSTYQAHLQTSQAKSL